MYKPETNGKKYLQLTDNILLEYSYVVDRFNDNANQLSLEEDSIGYGNVPEDEIIDTGTYGDSANQQYLTAKSGYNNEIYFINDSANTNYTNNVIENTVMPIRKDNSQWVRLVPNPAGEYYTVYDDKWCPNLVNGEQDLITQPANQEYVVYDIVRVYFQSGYHSEYDGFIINLYTKDKKNRYINLLSAIHENHTDVKMVSEPMWFADKIYSTYIEYRIPSTAYLSCDLTTYSMIANGWNGTSTDQSGYDRSNPPAGTMPKILAYDRTPDENNGFYMNPAIGIDVHAIVGYTTKHNFKVYKTRTIVSTLFPNKDSYDKLFAVVRDSEEGDYFELYGYYENDPSNPVYDPYSLYNYLNRFDGTFTVTHIITVSENWTDPDTNETYTSVQAPVTYIQTWDNLESAYENSSNPVIKFRPILEHTSNMLGGNDGANISYTLRIISNRDGTSIIKSGSLSILQPRRFGNHMECVTLYGTSNVHVYNRIEQNPTINISAVVSPIGAPRSSVTEAAAVTVNRYVTSSFIDRRNIRVSIAPVRIDNVEEI